jgi:sirohydrochlorin cobaltochelatase
LNGVILFAHGSRDPLWRGPIEAVATQVQALSPGTPVACAYLELCAPDLPTATQALIDQGVTHLTVLPVFFGMGKHAREDLPELLTQMRQRHPAVSFKALTAAGESPAITQLLAQLALAA